MEAKRGVQASRQVGAAGKSSKDNEDDDDPIAKSLKERMAAGGLNSIVAAKPGDKRTAYQPPARPQTTRPGASASKEESKTPINRTTAAKPTPGASSGSVGFAKKTSKDDDAADDPIAQAIKLRIAAGGLTSVISAADAKKMGL